MQNSYEVYGLAILATLAILPSVPVVYFAFRWFTNRKREGHRRQLTYLTVSAAITSLVYACVVVYAFLIEPNWPEVEWINIPAAISQPIRILQLSDLHIEAQDNYRQQWLRKKIREISPDLILLPGDIHQLGMHDSSSVQRNLGELSAPLGVFACSGYDKASVIRTPYPHIRFLDNKEVIITNGTDTIGLCGLYVKPGREKSFAAIASADARVAMSHTPELADEAVAQGIDLYVCGHTHGGQVRIPFWGAIVTKSAIGKKYEAGLYHVGKTYVYTSRGLGLESPPAPQVRFLCRPQITVFTLVPTKTP